MTEKLANIIYKILFFHLRLLDKIFNVRLSYVFMDLISKNSSSDLKENPALLLIKTSPTSETLSVHEKTGSL